MRIKILLAIMGAILPIVFIIFGGFILSSCEPQNNNSIPEQKKCYEITQDGKTYTECVDICYSSSRVYFINRGKVITYYGTFRVEEM